ncbi:EpsI family protein [Sphingomonas panacisoli]|uniref:EpsI family protein n=1 Tax=Sphingomonas panacisoli TaxID=1813879 RepID=A0A5B8LIA0_9SPHN|nr:exosortase-associated protein EpsI, V-type [Sphingomonas panacisoli]QDZ08037.1 EpsI family protein [Sphingomonas panacisoli]
MTDDGKPGFGPRVNRRAFIAGGAMLAASGAAMSRIPQPIAPAIASDKFNALVPDTIGSWHFQQTSGLVLPPEDALSARLYDNLVTRTYSDPAGQVIMLLIAYKNFQDGVLQIHRPEICYPAGGYTLSPTVATEIPLASDRVLPANAFSAIGNSRSEQVLYWTRIGEAFPVRWSEQRLAVLRANLARINPDGMLARVSMPNDDMASSRPLMIKFIEDLRNAAAPQLRRILFGPLA